LYGRFLAILNSDLLSACVDARLALPGLVFPVKYRSHYCNIIFFGIFHIYIDSLSFAFVNLPNAFVLNKSMDVRENDKVIVIISCAWFEVLLINIKLTITPFIDRRKFLIQIYINKVVELRRSFKLFEKVFKVFFVKEFIEFV
jgi:hypothetical protein